MFSDFFEKNANKVLINVPIVGDIVVDSVEALVAKYFDRYNFGELESKPGDRTVKSVIDSLLFCNGTKISTDNQDTATFEEAVKRISEIISE